MFNPEINRALVAAADLINTEAGPKSATHEPDALATPEGLQQYLSECDHELNWSYHKVPQAQLTKVRRLRGNLRRVWESSPVAETAELEIINELLEGVGTKLIRSEAAEMPAFREAPIPVNSQLSEQIRATVAAALAHLVVAEETGRLRICRGADCEAAIVDLTRNRSKLFCDFGNCANRAHVRAYRARQAARTESEPDNGRTKGGMEQVEVGATAAPSGQGTGRNLTKPSSAEKAEEINQPTSASAVAAKTFRDRMRTELMDKRGHESDRTPAKK